MANSVRDHYGRIRLILVIVLLLNWAVSAAKMLLGYLTRCDSMIADGFHSLSDGASNIVGLIGIALSSRPVDHDHPYGHRKYETFFSLGIAALLLLVAFSLLKEGISRFIHPSVPSVDVWSFAVMFVTMIVNIAVMKYEYTRGKKLGSDLLVADSMHTRADIFTSFTVIIALAGIRMGYPIVDPIATVVIALFIGYGCFTIVKEASVVLCDTAVLENVQRISAIVLAVKGTRACHKIRTRGRPDDISIDLHVQVDPDMHMEEAHRISCAIEDALKKGVDGVTDVLVHMEPKGRRAKR